VLGPGVEKQVTVVLRLEAARPHERKDLGSMTDDRLEDLEEINVTRERATLDALRMLATAGFGVAHGIVFTLCSQEDDPFLVGRLRFRDREPENAPG
jgi:hypothetical protein